IELDKYVTKEGGLPTLTDIVLELEKPGRDPRETAEEVPYDDSVRKIDDLHIGQELSGKVNNITAFGVFVDLGMKENGLIHISQLSERFISSPADVVSIGQTVRVRVIDVDTSRGRIALTLKGVAQ
ncbi:MAG: S1 RNA-binding domain-containing protein, partial [Duncaniella sp.]|nr:S1 RNA-binding domain-containing protein [Duncaniella sp.]